jgi:hypothetical protein
LIFETGESGIFGRFVPAGLTTVTFKREKKVVFFRVSQKNGEETMKKCMVVAICGLLLLAGCKQDKSAAVPTESKWKGEPYQIAFDAKPVKPSPNGVTIPPVNFKANPNALVNRAIVVLKFTASGVAEQLIVGTALDIKGAYGTLPENYMELARKGLSNYLESHCVKGKVDVSVALARSSLVPNATVAQTDDKRLSDWLPIELVYKNPHAKCK